MVVPESRTVLLVEDRSDPLPLPRDPAVREGVHCAVLVAHDRDAALAAGRPDLVIAGGRIGLDALSALRAEATTRTVPIVVLLTRESDVASIYRLGANSCILRPSGAAEGAALFDQLVRYWLLLNVRAPVAREAST